MTRPSTYGEFWGDYLRAHSDPRTRLIHYVGSILALAALALAVIELQPLWLLAMPVLGYGFAWCAHFFIEGNKPATFGHPFWSLISDYRMLLLWLTGALGPHLARHGVTGDRP
jgi:hypothetical protein